MKKLLIIATCLLLTSCGFESKKEFIEDQGKVSEENKQDFPEIKYIKSGDSNDSLEFDSTYGKNNKTDSILLKDAIGQLVDADFSGNKIGISLKQSSANPKAYAAILSYEQDNQLIEKEYGPVADDNKLFSNVTFDILSSESGPMLLVSQTIVEKEQTSSAYYLYNRYMSLLDSFQFENSISDINVNVYRLGEGIDVSSDPRPGSIEDAINKRVEKEDDYLIQILDTYNVSYIKISADIEGSEIKVGHMPKVADGRIIDIKMIGRDGEQVKLSIK